LVPDVEQITFSGAFARERGQSVVFITERAVFELGKDGVMLTEVAPGIDLQRDVLARIGFDVGVSPGLRKMDARIFRDEPMNLAPDFRAKAERGLAEQGHEL
jgi:propionate CoA-transferase